METVVDTLNVMFGVILCNWGLKIQISGRTSMNMRGVPVPEKSVGRGKVAYTIKEQKL